MNTLVVINGSYVKEGTTTRCLNAVSRMLCQRYNLRETYFFLEDDIRACINCFHQGSKCQLGCIIKDQFQEISNEIKSSERVLIGTPVYLDFPTPKVLAFLSRLNCFAENTNREFFRNKHIHLHANGYCSGTKATIRTMMGACEMLGFTIDGRSTTEYIEIWRDKKIRGGMGREDSCSL